MTLAVASDHVGRVRELLETRWRQHLDEDQQTAAAIVLDFEAEEMTCPACLTPFQTGPRECPECGLFLGG